MKTILFSTITLLAGPGLPNIDTSQDHFAVVDWQTCMDIATKMVPVASKTNEYSRERTEQVNVGNTVFTRIHNVSCYGAGD